MTPKKTHQFGILAERVALCFLWLKGYKILFWRYKTTCGEIDIIAKKGHILAIIEVKARRSKSNIEAVLGSKQVARIRNATSIFLSKHPTYQKHHVRFDFIVLNRFLILKHYKNYW